MLGKIELVCISCNIKFLRFPSQERSRSFCSKECYLKSNITSVGKICTTCGSEFRIRNYRNNKNTKNFFCSVSCRKTSKKIKCSNCRKSFLRIPSILRKNNFCSTLCMGQWQSKHQRGENSPTWLGGWIKYYGPNWVDQKNKARLRDHYTCQVCGKLENNKSHDVHHKKPFRLYESYRNANKLSNLLTVCNPCHSKIEPKGKQKIPT